MLSFLQILGAVIMVIGGFFMAGATTREQAEIGGIALFGGATLLLVASFLKYIWLAQ
jgi:hypothetical protein